MRHLQRVHESIVLPDDDPESDKTYESTYQQVHDKIVKCRNIQNLSDYHL